MAEGTLLKRACRRLTPASLRTAPSAPRVLTLLEDVVQRRGGPPTIVVSPVACPPAPAAHVSIDFDFEGTAWYVPAVVEEVRGSVVELRPRRDPERRPGRGLRVRPPAGRMVAVFVPEHTGLGVCCQPVLDISLRGLRVQSSFPFESGTLLRRLAVLHDHQVVRDAEGIVVGRTETIDPHGRRSFECSVRLRAPTQLAADDDPAELYEISEPARVRSILWALCDLGHEVTLRMGKHKLRGRLEPSGPRGARDALPAMRCTLADAEAPDLVGAVQLECTLYGSGYRFYARLTGKVGHVLMLAPAPVLREWHRRDEERLVLAAGVARFEFTHPVTGARAVRSVEDASVHGLGLRREADDELLWPGLPLTGARLILPGVTVEPQAVKVRRMADDRCGVELVGVDVREADRLRVELIQLGCRPIELSDGENLDDILRFHDSVHLLEPDMARNLDAAREATRCQWRMAHQHPDGLMRTALVRWKGGVGATLTLVRAYEKSWVLQHSAVASPAVPANPGMLHSLLVRLAIPRPDGEYVCGYIDEDARSQHAVMDAFFHEWSTPEHRGATRFALWAAETRPRAGARPRPRVRLLHRREELLVENAAARLLDPLCARALGLRAGEITLPTTQQQFARAGLERRREAWGSFGRGRCRAILLREVASPGLCLSSLMSAGVLLPVGSTGIDEDVAALVDTLLGEPLPSNPPVRFLLVPEGVEQRPLHAAGMRRVAGCTLYAMHRYGLQEYHRYVASKYGFLHGRLRARNTEAA